MIYNKILTLVIISLVLSMPIASAQFTSSAREDTGESIVVEVTNYEPKVVRSGLLEDQQRTPVIVSLSGLTLGSLVFGDSGSEYSPFYSQPEIRNVRINQKNSNPLISGFQHIPPLRREYTTTGDGRLIDLGNLIVYLNKIDSEKDLFPDANEKTLSRDDISIDLDFTATIDFATETSTLGLGTQSFYLPEYDDINNWQDAIQGSDLAYDSLFYNGLYLRVDRIRPEVKSEDVQGEPGQVSLDVYSYSQSGTSEGLRKVAGPYSLKVGEESRPIALKNNQESLLDYYRIRADSIEAPRDSVVLFYNNDRYNLYEGQQIPNSNYYIKEISEQSDSFVLSNGRRDHVLSLSYNLDVGEVSSKLSTIPLDNNFNQQLSERLTSTLQRLSEIPGAVDQIEDASMRYSVPRNLIIAVIAQESHGNLELISTKNAHGLMQVIPPTAQEMISLSGSGVPNLKSLGWQGNIEEIILDPIKSIELGTRYLWNLKNKENLPNNELILAAYNAGPRRSKQCIAQNKLTFEDCKEYIETARIRGIDPFYPETIDYVPQVLAMYQALNNIIPGESQLIQDKNQDQETITCSESMIIPPSRFADILQNKNILNEETNKKLHCTAIKELKILIDSFQDSDSSNLAYYLLGRLYENLDEKTVAISYYEKSTHSDAMSRLLNLEQEELRGLISEPITLEDEGAIIKLINIRRVPSVDKPTALINFNGGTVKQYKQYDLIKNPDDSVYIGTINLRNSQIEFNWQIIEIDSNSVKLITKFLDPSTSISTYSRNIQIERPTRVTYRDHISNFEVTSINTKSYASLTVLPGSGLAKSTSEFAVHIPVEKRSIQLTPETIDSHINFSLSMINKLDKAISVLDKIIGATLVACYGMWAFLMMLNVWSGPSAKARELVLRGFDGKSGWAQHCAANSGYDAEKGKQKTYANYDECINNFEDDIEKEVKQVSEILENNQDYMEDTFEAEWGDSKIISREEVSEYRVSVQRLDKISDTLSSSCDLSSEVQELGELDHVTKFNTCFEKLEKQCITQASSPPGSITCQQLSLLKSPIDSNNPYQKELMLQELESVLEGSDLPEQQLVEDYQNFVSSSAQISELPTVFQSKITRKELVQVYKNQSGTIKGLFRGEDGPEIIKLESMSYNEYNGVPNNEKIINVPGGQELEQVVLNNGQAVYTLESGEIVLARYLSDDFCDPLTRSLAEMDQQGRPLRIPVDARESCNYLKFEYNDGDSLTLIREWNVGPDGQRDTADDTSLRSYNSRDSDPDSRKIYEQYYSKWNSAAVGCDEDGKRIRDFVCKKATESTQDELNKLHCSDILPVASCKTIFFLCDPVMCPPSRFNLGGKYPVDNVIQTGIYGSLVLGGTSADPISGLTNIIPFSNGKLTNVCLPGIQAGLDGLRSVLQGYVQCLETAKTEGKTVGICDQITSVYACELFWREGYLIGKVWGSQLGILSPKQATTTGGGEYINLPSFGQRVSDNVKVFTNEYKTSTSSSYGSRSSEEIGSQICSAFFYGKAPSIGDLQSQIATPESPVQFTAYFEEFPYSETGLSQGFNRQSPQSMYKIYYHMYAGRTNDLTYSVYLRHPDGTIKYVTDEQGKRQAQIPKTTVVDKSLDLTDKEGYSEICVWYNGRQECGFSRVTTSFGLEEANNLLVSGSAQQQISSSQECMPTYTTGPTIGNIAVPTTAGDSQTGLNRVCSANNPGQGRGTEGKWQVVGTCGQDELNRELGKCWLDTSTIRITDAGILSDTNQNILATGENQITQQQRIAVQEMFKILDKQLNNYLDSSTFEIKSSENSKSLLLKSLNLGEDVRTLQTLTPALNELHKLLYGGIRTTEIPTSLDSSVITILDQYGPNYDNFVDLSDPSKTLALDSEITLNSQLRVAMIYYALADFTNSIQYATPQTTVETPQSGTQPRISVQNNEFIYTQDLLGSNFVASIIFDQENGWLIKSISPDSGINGVIIGSNDNKILLKKGKDVFLPMDEVGICETTHTTECIPGSYGPNMCEGTPRISECRSNQEFILKDLDGLDFKQGLRFIASTLATRRAKGFGWVKPDVDDLLLAYDGSGNLLLRLDYGDTNPENVESIIDDYYRNLLSAYNFIEIPAEILFEPITTPPHTIVYKADEWVTVSLRLIYQNDEWELREGSIQDSNIHNLILRNIRNKDFQEGLEGIAKVLVNRWAESEDQWSDYDDELLAYGSNGKLLTKYSFRRVISQEEENILIKQIKTSLLCVYGLIDNEACAQIEEPQETDTSHTEEPDTSTEENLETEQQTEETPKESIEPIQESTRTVITLNDDVSCTSLDESTSCQYSEINGKTILVELRGSVSNEIITSKSFTPVLGRDDIRFTQLSGCSEPPTSNLVYSKSRTESSGGTQETSGSAIFKTISCDKFDLTVYSNSLILVQLK